MRRPIKVNYSHSLRCFHVTFAFFCSLYQVHLALPIVFLVVCYFLVLLPFFVSPKESVIGAAITLSGIPVYFLTIYWESKPQIYRRIVSEYLSIVSGPIWDFLMMISASRNTETRLHHQSLLLLTHLDICFSSTCRFFHSNPSEAAAQCAGGEILTWKQWKEKKTQGFECKIKYAIHFGYFSLCSTDSRANNSTQFHASRDAWVYLCFVLPLH